MPEGLKCFDFPEMWDGPLVGAVEPEENRSDSEVDILGRDSRNVLPCLSFPK